MFLAPSQAHSSGLKPGAQSLVRANAVKQTSIHLNPRWPSGGQPNAAIIQRESFPKGFRLFKVRQTSRNGAANVQTPPDCIESEFNSGVIKGVHHVALLCDKIESSLEFYVGILGLEINPYRPHSKLPYRGAWLNIGSEMIHLMEVPNPDPLDGRPEHGGRDRHFCIGLEDGGVEALIGRLKDAGIEYTKSKSGRKAVFFRDPDMNCLEAVEIENWR